MAGVVFGLYDFEEGKSLHKVGKGKGLPQMAEELIEVMADSWKCLEILVGGFHKQRGRI